MMNLTFQLFVPCSFGHDGGELRIGGFDTKYDVSIPQES